MLSFIEVIDFAFDARQCSNFLNFLEYVTFLNTVTYFFLSIIIIYKYLYFLNFAILIKGRNLVNFKSIQ